MLSASRFILGKSDVPIFDFGCLKCGQVIEVLDLSNKGAPTCCGEVMTRRYTVGNLKIKIGYPRWIDRMDDIHKAQADRGERLRMVYPSEILHNWDKEKQKALQKIKGKSIAKS